MNLQDQIIQKDINNFQLNLLKKGYKHHTLAWTYNTYKFVKSLEKKYDIKIYSRLIDEWKYNKRIDCVFRLLMAKLLYIFKENSTK